MEATEMEIVEIDEDTTYVKGLGTVKETGRLDFENFIKSLLQSKYVTG